MRISQIVRIDRKSLPTSPGHVFPCASRLALAPAPLATTLLFLEWTWGDSRRCAAMQSEESRVNVPRETAVACITDYGGEIFSFVPCRGNNLEDVVSSR